MAEPVSLSIMKLIFQGLELGHKSVSRPQAGTRGLCPERDLSRFVQIDLGVVKRNCSVCAHGSGARTNCPILMARKLALGERSGDSAQKAPA